MLKVICQSTKRIDIIESSCAKYVSETVEELTVGQIYPVYGQCLIEGCLLYLLDPPTRDGSTRPHWYPAALFAVKDTQLPVSWMFMQYRQFDFSGIVTAVWGYKELVTSAKHFSGVIERDPQALEEFRKNKAQIEDDSQ